MRAAGGDNHHDLGLFSVGPRQRRAPPRGSIGLYHLAWEVPTIEDLASAARRPGRRRGTRAGPATTASPSRSTARDPDGNEFEIMWRVPREAWGEDEHKGVVRPLDLDAEVKRWAGGRGERLSRQAAGMDLPQEPAPPAADVAASGDTMGPAAEGAATGDETPATAEVAATRDTAAPEVEGEAPADEPGVVAQPGASLWWLLGAAALIFWLARPILGPFVIGAVLAYAFSPLVASAERRTGLPRLVIVVLGYVVALTGLGILGWAITGRLVEEFHLLAASGPDSLAAILRGLLGAESVVIGGTTVTVQQISEQIQSAIAGMLSSPGSAIEIVKGVGDLTLNAVLVIIVTFYLLVDGQRFLDRTVRILPLHRRARTTRLLGHIHDVLGRFLRGQLLLIALVAIVVYVILGPVLHLRYALAIAILTGVLEVIPLIGPVVAAAIAASDAFVQGGTQTALLVIVIYAVVRQVEDQVVMPVVIGRAVHLHPVVTIFAVLVGLSTYGVLGGLLGVPAAAAVNVVFRELYPPEPAIT